MDTILKENGKIIINSINPKWNLFLTIFEYLKFKQNSQARSYIHHKKVYSIAESSGFKLNAAFTRQIFPFKFLTIGNFLNKILEIILFKFNLGINNYLILSKSNNKYIPMTKSIIIPAKNEEKNLYPLISRIPKFETPYEIIIVCGKSKDLTLEKSQKIQKKILILIFKLLSKKVKEKGVLEAISLCKYELITVLDLIFLLLQKH